MLRENLALALNELATLLDLLGENSFKVRAHQNAARVIEMFEGDLEEAIKAGSIGDLKGIGPAIKEKIEEFHSHGKISEYEKLKNKIPPGLLDMLKVQGLGPKKVRAIYETLGLQSLGELELACRRNRLVDLEGFGQKTQEKILQGIEFLKKFRDKFLLSDAWLEAELILNVLKKSPYVEMVEVCGSLRRRRELIGDIDILVSTPKPQKVAEVFLTLPQIEKITAQGETKISVLLKNGMPCDLRLVKKEEFPFSLVYFTGSKEHNVALRQRAKDLGLKLNEYNLEGSKKQIKKEEDVYKVLGLDFIPPELRENLGEILAAEKSNLPQIVELSQLKGVFHCHTTDSDGVNSLEEMVAAAQKLGLEYIGISDHSAASVTYANGLIKERMVKQFQKIEEIQKKFKIRIFKGVEADILSEGELDYDPEFLLKFDFIIGSLHNALNQEEAKMTLRVKKALQNPLMDFFGHPTARVLLSRKEANFNVTEIIDTAVKNDVIIELNANPQRLDLDWRYGKYLKEKGGRVSINPDAHSVAGIEDIEFGISIARKGWLTSKQVINTLSADQVLKSLKGNKIRGHGRVSRK